MKHALLIAAVLGLSAAGAHACPYSNSAKAADKMTVASVETHRHATSKPDTATTGSIAAEPKKAETEQN